MPTNLQIATSKYLHPSNSEKFFPQDRDSIQTHYPPFPMVEFLRDELEPEYADDGLINPLHSKIIEVINKGKDSYAAKYKMLVTLMNGREITVDEFMDYTRRLGEASTVQVGEIPSNTGKSGRKASKLPSESLNTDKPAEGIPSRKAGILGTGFIRRIASKLAAIWGSKRQS